MKLVVCKWQDIKDIQGCIHLGLSPKFGQVISVLELCLLGWVFVLLGSDKLRLVIWCVIIGLLPVWHQDITWTKVDMSVEHWEINFNKILVKENASQNVSSKKMIIYWDDCVCHASVTCDMNSLQLLKSTIYTEIMTMTKNCLQNDSHLVQTSIWNKYHF